FGFRSAKAMFPTNFVLKFPNSFFTFSCAIAHIFRLPIMVITGVSANILPAYSLCKNELTGIDGLKYQGWYAKSIKSYFLERTSLEMGFILCGTCKNVSGNAPKNVSFVHGKGKSFSISTLRIST